MASNREHGNNASHRFKQPYSDKMMLIVAESWGMAREENVQKNILQSVYLLQIINFQLCIMLFGVEEHFFMSQNE